MQEPGDDTKEIEEKSGGGAAEDVYPWNKDA